MSSSNRPWDLLVVGGGTAGIVGAKTAAGLGARVALVEQDRTGGDCLWTGCVPSKALLAAAAAARSATVQAPALGIRTLAVEADFRAVMDHVRHAIRTIEPVDSVEALERGGVTVLHGRATFTGPRSADVAGREVRFHQALLATGATPAVPAVPGLPEAGPLTSDTVWDLTALPGRLVVMGGGTVGCELGQAFARLGSSVTILEAAPRLLSREDPDAAALVQAALEADGVTVVTGTPVMRVTGSPGGPGTVTAGRDGQERALAYDALLVAVGRRPRSAGLGLAHAAVDLDDRGFVRVDETLRTSSSRVWAAGDVTAHPQLTHVAGVHGSLAASNAVLGLRRKVELTAVPRVTFTDPEVAAVGAATWAADGPVPRTVTCGNDTVDRAVAEGSTAGFSRLVLDRRHRVTGATVVGPRAGEVLAELTLAVRRGLTTGDLAGTIHAYPTYADGPWHASIADTRARLATPAARAATWLLTRTRRLTAR